MTTEQEEIEESILSVVSKQLAPVIGLEADMPEKMVIPEIKKLLNKGRLKIGYALEGDMVQTYVFALVSPDSDKLYLSIDTGIEISIDPETPYIFQMDSPKFGKILGHSSAIH